MKKYNREQIIHWTMAIAAGLFIGLLIQFARAWTEPPAGVTPPGGNIGAPINTGSQSQAKSGGLGVMGGFVTDTNTFLARLGGNVGIGTGSPDSKLDVTGIAQANDFCLQDNSKCLSSGSSVTLGAEWISDRLPRPGGSWVYNRCPSGYVMTGLGTWSAIGASIDALKLICRKLQ